MLVMAQTHELQPSAPSARLRAASRVFNSVQLVGKTRAEVVGLLGDPQLSSDSIYNFPFYPAQKGSMIYRFDTGSGGWQFDVIFDNNGKVSSIERNGIE